MPIASAKNILVTEDLPPPSACGGQPLNMDPRQLSFPLPFPRPETDAMFKNAFERVVAPWRHVVPATDQAVEALSLFMTSSHRQNALRWLCHLDPDRWPEFLSTQSEEAPNETARRADRELETAIYVSADPRSVSTSSKLSSVAIWGWQHAYPSAQSSSSGYHWVEGHQNSDHVTRFERLLIHASFGSPSFLTHLEVIWDRIKPHAAQIAPLHFSRWIWWLCRGWPTAQVRRFIHIFHHHGGDLVLRLNDTAGRSLSALDMMLTSQNNEDTWPAGWAITTQTFAPSPSSTYPKPKAPTHPVCVVALPDWVRLKVDDKETDQFESVGPERQLIVSDLLRLGADPHAQIIPDSATPMTTAARGLAQLGYPDDARVSRWLAHDLCAWWLLWSKEGLSFRPTDRAMVYEVLSTSLARVQKVHTVLASAMLGSHAWWQPIEAPALILKLLNLPGMTWSTWHAAGSIFQNRQMHQVALRLRIDALVDALPWAPTALEAALDDHLASAPLGLLASEWVQAWQPLLKGNSAPSAVRALARYGDALDASQCSALRQDADLISALRAAQKTWKTSLPHRPMKATVPWVLYTPEAFKKISAKPTGDSDSAFENWTKKLAERGDRGGVRGLVLAHAALNAVPALRAGFPHFEAIIRRLEQHWALAAVGDRAFSLPPLLLAGPPGTGKTFFFSEMAKAVGTAYHVLNMESITAGFSITGLDPAWGNSQPGLVFEKLAMEDVINPIFLLDEIDKINRDNGVSAVEPVLLSLLEPHSAQIFQDRCMGLPMDIRPIAWVATANDLSKVSEPLVSRFEVIHVPQPDLAARHALARMIYTSLRQSNSWGKFFDPDPTYAFIQAIVGPPGSARDLRKMLTQAFATAALARRSDLRESDLSDYHRPRARPLWDQPLPELSTPARMLGAQA